MKIKFPNIFGKKANAPTVPEPTIQVPAPEEDEIIIKMKKVNIKALEGTQMTPGKVYSVSSEAADFLVEKKRAVLAKDSEKVGKVYKYPQPEPDITN